MRIRDTEFEPVWRALAADLPVGAGLFQRESTAEQPVEPGLPRGGALPRVGLDLLREVREKLAGADRGQRGVQGRTMAGDQVGGVAGHGGSLRGCGTARAVPVLIRRAFFLE